MPQTATVEERLRIYRRVLVEEFLRELKFLIDALAGRAQKRGDFTDKIVGVMKSGVSAAVSKIPCPPVPGAEAAKDIIAELAKLGLDKLNDNRKDKKFEGIKEIQYDVDFEALRIVLEVVALHACRRYEFVISTKLSEVPSEAVIPFAKAGVERMLEYIARLKLPLKPEELLTGLLYGRSGAYVSGFFNTRLTGKDKKVHYTAEGIYARSAFNTIEGKYWVAAKAPSHDIKPLLRDFTDLIPDAVKGFVKGKNAPAAAPKPLRVKFESDKKTPKYGYAMMTQKAVDAYYGQTKQEQMLTNVSASLQQAVKSATNAYQVVTRTDIEGYLKGDKKISFLQYLKTKYPAIKAAAYEPANDQDYDLTAFNCKGANFNDCLLNGVKLGGDLSNAQFQNAGLFGADFSKVTAANGLNLQNAHCEFLKAEGANLAHADFTGTQCQFGDFTGANLSHIQPLGAQWVGAKLVNLKTEDKKAETTLVQTQQKQDSDLKAQQKKMQALEAQLQQQQQEVTDLQAAIQKLEAQFEKAVQEQDKAKAAQVLTLQKVVADLQQEHQTRETFTRYCQSQLNNLQEKADSSEKKLNLHDEQIKQLQQQIKASKGVDAPIKPFIADLQAAITRLDTLEAKQQQTDSHVKELETRVSDYVKSQHMTMESVFEGLSNIQQEIVRFKQEVRQDIHLMDEHVKAMERRVSDLEARLAAPNAQPIPVDERQAIFAQQFLSMMNQVTGLQVARPQPKPPIDSQHVIASTQLSFQRKLADGSFGKVYLGRWCEQEVAIKMLEGRLSSGEEKEFIREVNIMSRLRHPHIVQFIGACLESSRACLVMEHMALGSLAHYLEKAPLVPQQQKQLALEIIKGLIYLHSQKVLHRDIKSGNVLINAEGHAKISDFGLSKVEYTSIQSIQKQADAVQYQSPESLKGEEYTEKSDIYSLGIVLWEIFTRKKPYANLNGAALVKAILNGQREEIPKDVPPSIADLIKACWQMEPHQRPALTHLLREIESYQPRSLSPTPETYYNQGIEAEKAKDMVKARTCYEKAAHKDYPRAKTNLGNFFLKGLGGCPVDKQQAYRCFLSGAEAGHVRAMFNLAVMLEKGDGIPKDLKQALHWFEQAAAKGDKDAPTRAAKLKTLIQQSGSQDYRNNMSMQP